MYATSPCQETLHIASESTLIGVLNRLWAVRPSGISVAAIPLNALPAPLFPFHWQYNSVVSAGYVFRTLQQRPKECAHRVPHPARSVPILKGTSRDVTHARQSPIFVPREVHVVVLTTRGALFGLQHCQMTNGALSRPTVAILFQAVFQVTGATCGCG